MSEAKISRSGRRWAGSADMELDRLMLKGYTYLAAKAHAELDNGMLTASASIDNPDLEFALQGAYSLTPGLKHITLSGDVGRFVPSNLNLWGRFPGGDITGKIDVALEGRHSAIWTDMPPFQDGNWPFPAAGAATR